MKKKMVEDKDEDGMKRGGHVKRARGGSIKGPFSSAHGSGQKRNGKSRSGHEGESGGRKK